MFVGVNHYLQANIIVDNNEKKKKKRQRIFSSLLYLVLQPLSRHISTSHALNIFIE
jgi:hypothetical protein